MYVSGNNIQAHLSHVVLAWIYLLVGIPLGVNVVAFGKQKLCAVWIKKITDPASIEQFLSPLWFWKHFKETITDASSSAFSYFN